MEQAAKTVVITGAASGMGRATASRFHAHGWRVVAIDVVEAEPPATTGAGEASGATAATGEWLAAKADVRSRAELDALLGSLLGEGARIDAVANIAGVYPPTTLDRYDEATYRRIFDINVLGVVNVIAAARPYLGEGSAVVNFASVDAFQVSRGQLFYGASKAAVVMLSKSLALELADAGIRVNGIAPGWVSTPGNAATGRMEAAAGSIPLGRVAEPDEIARWVELLVDPATVSFMTGETIVLSGGDVIR